MTGRVLFEKCLARALELGADSFIEFGPGGKLTGMAARVYADIPRLTIAEPGDLEKVAMELSA
ncbi:MAG: hypothetical protein M5R36_01975 [Deltaproteobacteria bacterium]|nr:hypothetical protein [Deltaproteobacteria bacterium]